MSEPRQQSTASIARQPACRPSWRRTAIDRRPPHRAIILKTNGDTEIHDVKDEGVVDSVGAFYASEAFARFWVDEKLRPGWITVYVQNNPEPITTRDPLGYDAKTLAKLVGVYALHLVGGGLKPKPSLTRNARLALLAVGLLTLLGTLGYLYYRWRFQ